MSTGSGTGTRASPPYTAPEGETRTKASPACDAPRSLLYLAGLDAEDVEIPRVPEPLEPRGGEFGVEPSVGDVVHLPAEGDLGLIGALGAVGAESHH